MKVLIAGAGVGGLTLALMLHRRGIESVIFEQASEIREVGVGINILPHAIKELAALDLMPKLDAVGDPHQGTALRQPAWSEGVERTARHGRRLRLSAVLDPSRPAAESDPRRSDGQTWSRRDTRRPEAAGLRPGRGRRRRAFHGRQVRADAARPCAETCSSARTASTPSCAAISTRSRAARVGKG